MLELTSYNSREVLIVDDDANAVLVLNLRNNGSTRISGISMSAPCGWEVESHSGVLKPESSIDVRVKVAPLPGQSGRSSALIEATTGEKLKATAELVIMHQNLWNIEPASIQAQPLFADGQVRVSVEISAVASNIDSVKVTSDNLQGARVFKGSKGNWIVEGALDNEVKPGKYSSDITLEINGRDFESVKVPVHYEVKSAYSPEPPSLVFAQGSSDVIVTQIPVLNTNVLEVVEVPEDIEVDIVRLGSKGAKLTVRRKKSSPGEIKRGLIAIRTGDARQPTLTIPVSIVGS